jgi:hypothetical protein
VAGYLEEYGAGDERREKRFRRLVIAGVLLLIAAVVLWYYFRNFREDSRVSEFLQLLRQQNYKAAYAAWGCTESRPCPDYNFDRFLEDWGPKSGHGSMDAARVDKTFRDRWNQSCRSGVIYTIRFAQGDPTWLWVEREDKTLTFAPWPACTTRPEP